MQRPLPYYSCVDYSANVISYPGDSARMRGFYRKLDSLALFGKGNVNIVHIGGSHVQADVMSDRLRSNFTQCIPGFRAGRGMIFPYRAARTNNPANYSISYTGSWRKCQNSLPPVDLSLGISGIAVSSDDRHASISFLLNPDSLHRPWQYRHLRLMASVSDTALTPVLIVDSDTIAPSDVSHLCSPDSATLTSTAYYTYRLPYLTDHGTVALCPTSRLSSLTAATQHRHSFSVDTAGYSSPDSLCIGLESDNASSSATVPTSVTTQNKYLFTVNGFIPENDLNGITYHSLGVNGASLPSWLRCSNSVPRCTSCSPTWLSWQSVSTTPTSATVVSTPPNTKPITTAFFTRSMQSTPGAPSSSSPTTTVYSAPVVTPTEPTATPLS